MPDETKVIIIPKGLHAGEHETGGIDEVSVLDLLGLLADDQHVLDAEVLAVAEAIGVAAGLIVTHAGLPNAHHTPLALTELAGGEAYTGGTDWTDWDLSGIIGVGAKVVHIGVRKTATTGQPGGLRKNGVAYSRNVIGAGSPECEGAFDVECDANRIVETRSPTSTALYQFQVLGYWS